MSYPFVPAYHRYGTRKGPPLAMVWHMAEGGGTVSYLSKPNRNKVSVHFVIEYTGRIVQMLPLHEASGSIRPTAIRTTDDADGQYGASYVRAVLGSWARDPNSAVISVEMEGFAATGPRPVQVAAAYRLAADMRSQLPELRGNLGHRDFADYKACPGRTPAIFEVFALAGGHGLFEEDVEITRIRIERWRAVNGNGVLRRRPVRTDAPFTRLPDGTEVTSFAEARSADGNNWRLVDHNGPAWALRSDYEPLVPGGDPTLDKVGAALRAGDEVVLPEAVADIVQDAIEEDRRLARIVWGDPA